MTSLRHAVAQIANKFTPPPILKAIRKGEMQSYPLGAVVYAKYATIRGGQGVNLYIWLDGTEWIGTRYWSNLNALGQLGGKVIEALRVKVMGYAEQRGIKLHENFELVFYNNEFYETMSDVELTTWLIRSPKDEHAMLEANERGLIETLQAQLDTPDVEYLKEHLAHEIGMLKNLATYYVKEKQRRAAQNAQRDDEHTGDIATGTHETDGDGKAGIIDAEVMEPHDTVTTNESVLTEQIPV